jgi:hypothetical protein
LFCNPKQAIHNVHNNITLSYLFTNPPFAQIQIAVTMMSRSICFLSLFFALCVSVSMAFSMPKQSVHPSTTAKIDIKVTTAAVTTTAAAATAFVTSVMYPLAALAVQEDNYEYGAVDAPPLVPIIGGVLAILTCCQSCGEVVKRRLKK